MTRSIAARADGGARDLALCVIDSGHAPQGHLLAQPDAVAVEDLPLLLQVLRVRDPPGAPAPARGGDRDPRRRRSPARQGAAGADRGAARGQPAGARRCWPSTGTRTSPPTSSGSASARSSAACCRTPTSACSTGDDLARLREVTASQGLMLESISERLMQTVHAGSPTKHPARRIETIAAAGELRIPFTSGILVGIGETEQERMDSLAAIAELHERHGHIQEVILQNFVPHQRYYGQEPAEIADAAAREYWRTGVAGAPAVAAAARVGVSGRDRGHEAADRRDAAADARRRHPGPAEPRRLVGRAGRRRRHRSRRALGERRSHLARASRSRRRTRSARSSSATASRSPSACASTPSYIDPEWHGPGGARHDQGALLVVHPAARLRAHGAADADRREPRARGDRTRARRARAERRRS